MPQILLMEVALDSGSWPDDNVNDGGNAIVTDSSRAAEEFLAEFPLARIIVIIDTHCSESGFFLWKGSLKGDFETSPLLPVCTMLHRFFLFLHSSRSYKTVYHKGSSSFCLMRRKHQIIHTGR